MNRLFAVLVSLTSSLVLAQTVPGSISFNARLTDTGGAPVTGSHALSFGLYSQTTGGAAVWTEMVANASFSTDGLVYVELGSTTALTPAALDGSKLYLEVQVDGTTMAPRLPVVSVPYAVRASVAASALSVGTLTESNIQRRVTGTCSSGQAIRSIDAAGGVQCENAGLMTCPAGQIPKSNGTGYACAADDTGLMSITGTAPINVTTGATPVVSIATANATTTGALSSADWVRFDTAATSGGGGAPSTVAGLETVASWTSRAGTLPGVSLNTSDTIEGGAAVDLNVATALGANLPEVVYGEAVAIDARRPYRARVTARLVSGGGNFSAGIAAYDAAGTYLATRFFIVNNYTWPASPATYTDFTGWIGGTGTQVYRFPANTRFIRPAFIVNSNNQGITRIDAFKFEPSRCRAGFVPAGDDGVCVQEAIQGPSQAIPGIGVCKAQGPGARICTYNDLQMACGNETVAFRAATANWPFNAAGQGWLGDHARVETTGNTDDEYLTWNVNGCSDNADGAAFATDQLSVQYRCCY